MCYTIIVRREVEFESEAGDSREATGLGAEMPTIELYQKLTKKSLKKVLTKPQTLVIIRVKIRIGDKKS